MTAPLSRPAGRDVSADPELPALENVSFAALDLGIVVDVKGTGSFAVFLTQPLTAGVVSVIRWLPNVFVVTDRGGRLTLIDSAALACCAGLPESAAVTVRLALPAADGLPEITPLDPFRASPAT